MQVKRKEISPLVTSVNYKNSCEFKKVTNRLQKPNIKRFVYTKNKKKIIELKKRSIKSLQFLQAEEEKYWKVSLVEFDDVGILQN